MTKVIRDYVKWFRLSTYNLQLTTSLVSNLAQRQQKIQENRKNTPRREFVMKRLSRRPFTFSKHNGKISRYPEARISNVIDFQDFNKLRDWWLDVERDFYSWDFFQNYLALFSQVPKRNLMHYTENENSQFADGVLGAKNAYLSMVAIKDVENILYSLDVRYNCSDVFSSVYVYDGSSQVYESKVVINSSKIFFSANILNSYDIRNSSNLIGCSECLSCDWLSNKSYCIENKEYQKDEYLKLKAEYMKELEKHTSKSSRKSDYQNFWSADCEGGFIHNSTNIHGGYMVSWMQNGRNLVLSGSPHVDEDCYDSFIVWRCKHIYGCEELGAFSEHIYLSTHVFTSSNCYYCFDIDTCSFCLGCVGLKNKSYCILNKQYTKEERYEKIDEIFWKMHEDWVLWDFLPWSLNPFYFNDTAAYLIDDSFTKEEVVSAWYLWRDDPIKVDIPSDAEVVKSDILNQFESFDTDWNRTIDPEILKCVIQDEQGNYYRIIPMEYKFLVKHGLPLPRKHWLDRMKENFRIN